MNKWYQSAPCKGILLVLEHILAAIAAVCLVWTLTYPAGSISGIISDKTEKEYKNSQAFEQQLRDAAAQIVWAEPVWEEFKTDGAYDGDKLVDIKEFVNERKVSGENQSGLAYKLDELVNWSQEGLDEGYGYSNEENVSKNIIVCKKEDETCQYYYADEFTALVKEGSLRFGNLAEAKEDWGLNTDEEIAEALVRDWASDVLYRNILDSEGKQVYTSCWLYDGYYIEEKYAPDGAENILEIVNSNPKWNGKLDEMMHNISETVSGISWDVRESKYVQEQWSEGNTNLSFMLVDLQTNKVYTNRIRYQKADDWKTNLEDMKKAGKYVIVTPKLGEFQSNMKESADVWKSTVGENSWTDDYAFAFAVDTDYPIQDQFYQEDQIYGQYAPIARTIFISGILASAGAVICLVWLTIIAGRSNKEEGIRLLAIDRIKTEIFAVIAGAIFIFTVYGAYRAFTHIVGGAYYSYQVSTAEASVGYSISSGDMVWTVENMMLFGGVMLFVWAAVMILWLGLVRRAKAGTLWKNSLIKWLGGFVKILLTHISILWKTILAFGCFVVIHWIGALMWDAGAWWFVMLAVELVVFVYLMRYTIGRRTIKKGVVTIADGEVDYQIPLRGLTGEQLEVAQCINKIGDGLERALEESMKNERMKTDLITNVSHDIKTPLTSIINYVELLKRENFEDPKIQNYLKVLEEKAQRLKTLTEDVVEASKVSSGNVKLEKINLNLVELINQASAEFEEKFEANDLKVIINMPGEPATIYADGRRMWRVLSNIFNNAAKYAMRDTRVYADLMLTEKEVVFTLKNISEQQLNISADELTERFIRGDVSRSTEGSGLGLSIARNLTELQGGTFELYLDGDLFKVLIRFPRVEEEFHSFGDPGLYTEV